ncbi:MAG: DUF429 domain-containing protein [Candidatus Nanopelagicales bacterium]
MILVAGEWFAGLDLAWSSGWTGVAVVDESGRVLSSGRVRTDAQIAEWVVAQPGRLSVVAVDAPLIVPNDTGQRLGERLIGRAYSAYGAAAHTSNRGTFGGAESRAMTLARRFGWVVDPAAAPSQGQTRCIEVYPHPALVGLFGLPCRIDYKKGGTARRLPGFLSLARLLESIPELGLAAYSCSRFGPCSSPASTPQRARSPTPRPQAHVGRIPNGLGPVLDLLEQHCDARGWPNLAVLVVNKATRTPPSTPPSTGPPSRSAATRTTGRARNRSGIGSSALAGVRRNLATGVPGLGPSTCAGRDRSAGRGPRWRRHHGCGGSGGW